MVNVHEFQAKWRGNSNKERSASQEHFLDLCAVLGQPTPSQFDKAGLVYTFEKGASKTSGGDGFADVWWIGKFGWEYKGHKANLKKAYEQLLQYREDLGNPPLLVVCDLDHFQVHTNFTGTAKKVYEFTLDELDQTANLRVLRAVFDDPESLRPDQTVESVTEAAAARFGALAASLQARGFEPPRIAHFLVQLLFALFAEDAGLLPRNLVSGLLAFGGKHPDHFVAQARQLFESMRDGGFVNYQEIAHFNGGLFATVDPLPLSADELTTLAAASGLDWGSVEPAIFGTLFERSLDPGKRAQLGAHYTGRADIERVVEPVVMTPLRRRWEDVQASAALLKKKWDEAKPGAARDRARNEFAGALFAFQEELAAVTILDPACGSGNFLYVALARLQDLEKEVVTYGLANGLPAMLPRVGPRQLYGLEINEYAHELAQVVVWIGYLQWMTANGFQVSREPVLEALDTIKLQDALLDLSDPEHPREAEWPAADFIIGNPPFLGGKRLRAELGNTIVELLFQVFERRVPREADLVCYFFEKARAEIQVLPGTRAGLLATNSIRGGANRVVLSRIKSAGDIFLAWSDQPWILDGAAVRISIVGFGAMSVTHPLLDGLPVASINADLTGSVDITTAERLRENLGMSFMGDTKGGPFDISGKLARSWLLQPTNPNGRPNSDVVRPWMNGLDLTRRARDMWIVDFGVDRKQTEAALYEAPFEYVLKHVKPTRESNNRVAYRERWWLHVEPRSGMRAALKHLQRFICTPTVAKHRLFIRCDVSVLPDHQLIVFAREDDYFFGVLHSRAHEVWSLRMGTSLEDRPRYTPTTCFETFPLPWAPGTEPVDDPRVIEIGAAAKALDDLRRAWLDPVSAAEAELKKRTLTNLYNARPTWLVNAHARLDRAVWAAYGWDDPDPAAVAEDAILIRLLALNLARAAAPSPS